MSLSAYAGGRGRERDRDRDRDFYAEPRTRRRVDESYGYGDDGGDASGEAPASRRRNTQREDEQQPQQEQMQTQSRPGKWRASEALVAQTRRRVQDDARRSWSEYERRAERRRESYDHRMRNAVKRQVNQQFQPGQERMLF